MPLRLTISAFCLFALLAAAWTSTARRASVLHLAHIALGSQPYAVYLRDRPVGQLELRAARLANGDLEYTSTLGFQLGDGQPVRVEETRRFAGRPPYALLVANQLDVTGTRNSEVRLAQQPTGYDLAIRRGDRRDTRATSLEHTLIDYLAVEAWLSTPALTKGARHSFESFDFAALDLRRDTWTFDARTPFGYRVKKTSRLEATTLELDAQFRPVAFDLAGTFKIVAVEPHDLPVVPEPIFHSEAYQIPLDVPIADRELTRALTLRVHGNTALVRDWEATQVSGNHVVLRSHRGTIRPPGDTPTERFLREELSYPLSDERVQQLARDAVSPLARPLQRAEQLTEFVHNYIGYDHHSTMQNVLEVVRSRRGDCNEYAELYTTLGRALGLPVRTVIGLAYTDRIQPAFALHAWNEVLLDGGWRGFDPTWNETELDATHIPLPHDSGSMLLGISALDELRFELVDVSYL